MISCGPADLAFDATGRLVGLRILARSYFDPLSNSVVHVLQLAGGAWFGVAQDPGSQVIKTILYDTKWSSVVKKRFR